MSEEPKEVLFVVDRQLKFEERRALRARFGLPQGKGVFLSNRAIFSNPPLYKEIVIIHPAGTRDAPIRHRVNLQSKLAPGACIYEIKLEG